MTDASRQSEDDDLLRAYVEQQSGAAFAELVRRHADAVFGSALRRVHGDRALAEDIAQQVFTDLARKAARLPAGTVLGGWLHRHTGFTASHFIDRERRRRAREQEAARMNLPDNEDGAALRMAPLLDEAMDALPAPDRDALVLRFFEKRDYRGVGAVLGVRDDTAQKRVTRALDKLRALLARRGVTGSAGALAAVLTGATAEPAAAAFAETLPERALAGAAGSPRSIMEAAASLAAGARVRVAAAALALTAAGAVPGWLSATRPAHQHAAPAGTGAEIPAAEAAPQVGRAAGLTEPSVPGESAASLVARAAAVLRGGNQTVTATAEALGLLSRIPAEAMAEALAAAAAVTDEPARLLVQKHLLARWTETDPAAALAHAQELSGTAGGMALEAVLAAWGAGNPEAVLGWHAKASGAAAAPGRESLVAALFRSLASRDLARALALLERAPDGSSRANAVRGVMEGAFTGEARERVLSAAGALTDDELRVQLRRAAVESWARQAPEAAAAWVEQVEPAWERPRLRDSLGLAWLQRDPAAAAAWWTQQEPGPDTLVKIINVWAQEDPNAAGAWLRQQPAGPVGDAARMTFARQVADLDPESALTWAATVTDAAIRDGTLRHIWRRWAARDAGAAAALLARPEWQARRDVLEGGR